MQERRRKFYGWGYEGDEVSREENAEFEKAWTRLLGVTDFEPVPFPTEDSIKLRVPRVPLWQGQLRQQSSRTSDQVLRASKDCNDCDCDFG